LIFLQSATSNVNSSLLLVLNKSYLDPLYNRILSVCNEGILLGLKLKYSLYLKNQAHFQLNLPQLEAFHQIYWECIQSSVIKLL
jgi:hypothetical protein